MCLHNHHGITGAMLSEWDAAGSVCAGVCTHGKPSQIHIWRGRGGGEVLIVGVSSELHDHMQ